MPSRRITVRTTVRTRVQVRYRLQQRVQMQAVSLPRMPASPSLRLTATRPLADIRQAAADYREAQGIVDDGRSYDVFLSHASEDQAEVARPLRDLLEAEGLRVWYSESVLTPGRSLRRSIDLGLANSDFGVVVLSQHFFDKEWPNRELDGLVTRSIVEGRQLILPVWHGVSTGDVARYSPPLADRVALRTADTGLAEIARQIAAAIRA